MPLFVVRRVFQPVAAGVTVTPLPPRTAIAATIRSLFWTAGMVRASVVTWPVLLVVVEARCVTAGSMT